MNIATFIADTGTNPLPGLLASYLLYKSQIKHLSPEEQKELLKITLKKYSKERDTYIKKIRGQEVLSFDNEEQHGDFVYSA